MKLYLGQLFITSQAFIDLDEEGRERVTPAGSVGRLAGRNNNDVWDMVFDCNGAWLCPSEADLHDRLQFKEL